MARTMWKPAALALGAVLAVSGIAAADDNARLGGSGPAKAGFNGGVITLGGTGTIAAAATADDTELMHYRPYYGYGGYHGYYGGYRGYGGYGGHRGLPRVFRLPAGGFFPRVFLAGVLFPPRGRRLAPPG